MGTRLAQLTDAKRRILQQPTARLVAQSPVYETEPVDVKPIYRDYKFLNAVLVIDSPWDAQRWLQEGNRIETEMGRKRSEDRNAPRPIDIDIIYAGELCVAKEGLVVPHPRWAQRGFVVKPLADVRPNLKLPGSMGTVRKVLESLGEIKDVRKVTDNW
jgi:2-amino-4-hydroxy-6-hydroxymethyldihydropteridine diphosphokinase